MDSAAMAKLSRCSDHRIMGNSIRHGCQERRSPMLCIVEKARASHIAGTDAHGGTSNV